MKDYLWQEKAFGGWIEKGEQCFIISATPGSGKTYLTMNIIKHAMAYFNIEQIIIVTPTDYLKDQWANEAHACGVNIGVEFKAGDDFDGFATTYHHVNTSAGALRGLCGRKDTIVVLDEIHHCGDEKQWGKSVRSAFEHAQHIIGLTGTLFRSDKRSIPFVEYEYISDDDTYRCQPDFKYIYGEALADGILKAVIFPHVDGEAEWVFKGENVKSQLSEVTTDRRIVSQRKQVAYDLDGKEYISEWLHNTLKMAHAKLISLRCPDIRPDCAGIIFVKDQNTARNYETNIAIRKILGCTPKVVYCDKPDSKNIIEEFKHSADPWIVAVKIISEGVDIPRLTVGVYATIETAELIFKQRVGRIIRTEVDLYPENINAFMYIPSDPDMMALAQEIRDETDYFLDNADLDEIGLTKDISDREMSELILCEMTGVELRGVIYFSNNYNVDARVEQLYNKSNGSLCKADITIMLAKMEEMGMLKDAQQPIEEINKPALDTMPLYRRMNELKRGEDRLIKKLLRDMKNKGLLNETEIGELKHKIWIKLKNATTSKPDCTMKDLKHRHDIIKGWIRDGYR